MSKLIRFISVGVCSGTIALLAGGCGADVTEEDGAGDTSGEDGEEVGTSEAALSGCGAICGGAGASACIPFKHPAGVVACGVVSSIACEALCSPGKPRRICGWHPGAHCVLYDPKPVWTPSGTIRHCKGYTC